MKIISVECTRRHERTDRKAADYFIFDAGKVLTTPALYIFFLKKNRVEYYDRMSEVRDKGNYEQWVKFFLEALSASAKDALDATGKLISLHDKNIGLISKMGRASKGSFALFGCPEADPIIEIGKTVEALALSYNTVSAAVGRLTDADILAKTSSANRNRTFSNEEYLNILREGT